MQSLKILDLLVIYHLCLSLQKKRLSVNCLSIVSTTPQLFPPVQFHSTETALLKVQNDILMNMDRQEITLLVLLDLSAAFDTIDHRVLLDTLESDFGVVGNALKWIESFLSGRKHYYRMNREYSSDSAVICPVPQGSCLGPVLFLFYVSQLFQAVKAIDACIADVRSWLVSYKLLFNDSKTELLIIGTRQQLSKIKIDSVRVGDVDIKPVDSVRNLGSWFDIHMSTNVHVGKVCGKAFCTTYDK